MILRKIYLTTVLLLVACGDGDKSKLQDFCISPRIINGEICSNIEGPTIKLVLLDEEDNPKICSAVLISQNTALTAWHCFDEVVFSGFAEIDGKKINITDVKLHPQALPLPSGEVLNDLALLTLETGSQVYNSVSEVSLSKILPGQSLEIYGFGQGSADGSAGMLRRGTMTISSVDENFIKTTFKGEGQNTCFGDSGGPAFLVTEQGLELVGILSSGTNQSCGLGDENIFVNLQSAPSKGFIKFP